MAIGNDILASDYNSIRSKIADVLGTGLADRGYGQPLISSPAQIGQEITAQQWSNLRADLYNIELHQTGVIPQLVSISKGDLIEFGAAKPNNNFVTKINNLDINRFRIGQSRSTVFNRGTVNFNQSWSTALESIVTVSFVNANQARYFFNSGGKIRFSSSRTGGTASIQNTSWTTFLFSVGTVEFGGNTSQVNNFYKLTNNYQTIFQLSPINTYVINLFTIEAKVNVTSNLTGTATQIDFRIRWIDAQSNQPDNVDGTLALTVSEIKDIGPILPSSTNFNIVSPTYNLSPIAVF